MYIGCVCTRVYTSEDVGCIYTGWVFLCMRVYTGVAVRCMCTHDGCMRVYTSVA